MEGNSFKRYAEIYNSYFIAEKLKENKGHIHCPVNGWDCPYYKNGKCTMYPESDPIEECDDFAYFWDVEDDYICYEED